MSCSIAFDRFASYTPDHLPIVVKSRSCPSLGRKVTKARSGKVKEVDPFVKDLIKKLILTQKIEFRFNNDGTISCGGRMMRADEVKQMVEKIGFPVFQSNVSVFSDDVIPSGTLFLVFTIKDPVPKGFF